MIVKQHQILIYLILVLLSSNCIVSAQNNNHDLQSAVYFLSDFIASPKFSELGNHYSDLELIDILFHEAVKFYNNDYSEALLALSVATLTFNEMSVTLPILKLKFNLPLPSIDDSTFATRLENQPGIILKDSPKTANEDKDKLPHFFGSAFLSYNVRFFNLSKFIGILVELFEDTFKVQGKVDNRDMIANSLGDLFGAALNDNPKVLPSRVLQMNILFFCKYKFL